MVLCKEDAAAAAEEASEAQSPEEESGALQRAPRERVELRRETNYKGYVVSHTQKKRIGRLHLVGSCFRIPGVDY